jgi:CRP-like cAMP-binding protein
MSVRSNIFADGRRQISAVHITGDFVDLHGFLLETMDHNVNALSAVKVAFVPHTAIRAITENEPHLTRLLWLLTLIDAATHRQWLAAAGRLLAAEQMARFICEMLTRMEAAGLVDDLTFSLPLSQIALGDALGLSTVHVNRTLQDLRRRGLVRWTGTTVTVMDRARLEELGEFDPAYLNLVRMPR